MNVAPGGIAGVFGALSVDPQRSAGAARSAPAKPATTAAQAVQAPAFERGLHFARAVSAAEKPAATPPPPSPNLPRGSLIDLKV